MGNKKFVMPVLTQAEGHLIGNHTCSHMQLAKKNREKFKEELVRTNEVLEEITGVEVGYVRLPYGSWDKNFEEELYMIPVLGFERLHKYYGDIQKWVSSFIPASNEPSSRACTDIWRMPRGSNTPQLCCASSLIPRQLAAGYLIIVQRIRKVDHDYRLMEGGEDLDDN